MVFGFLLKERSYSIVLSVSGCGPGRVRRVGPRLRGNTWAWTWGQAPRKTSGSRSSPICLPMLGLCFVRGRVYQLGFNFSRAMPTASSSSSSNLCRCLGQLRPPTGGHCNPSQAHRGWLCHRLWWKRLPRLGSRHLHRSSLFRKRPRLFGRRSRRRQP